MGALLHVSGVQPDTLPTSPYAKGILAYVIHPTERLLLPRPQHSRFLCPDSPPGVARRRCAGSVTSGAPAWLLPDLTGCVSRWLSDAMQQVSVTSPPADCALFYAPTSLSPARSLTTNSPLCNITSAFIPY